MDRGESDSEKNLPILALQYLLPFSISVGCIRFAVFVYLWNLFCPQLARYLHEAGKSAD